MSATLAPPRQRPCIVAPADSGARAGRRPGQLDCRLVVRRLVLGRGPGHLAVLRAAARSEQDTSAIAQPEPISRAPSSAIVHRRPRGPSPRGLAWARSRACRARAGRRPCKRSGCGRARAPGTSHPQAPERASAWSPRAGAEWARSGDPSVLMSRESGAGGGPARLKMPRTPGRSASSMARTTSSSWMTCIIGSKPSSVGITGSRR